MSTVPAATRTVKMQGGLGNQLFCLAFARSVARMGGGQVALDLAAFKTDRHGRTFELAELATHIGDISFSRRPILGGRIAGAIARSAPWPGYVSEPPPPADAVELAAMIGGGVYFNGYWQNEAFIDDPRGWIRMVRDYAFSQAADTPRREVVIHYRTYKEERRAAARRVPDNAYVRSALQAIEGRLGPVSEVRLISDDPALAVARLGDIGRPLIAESGGGAWGDMALLMRARALILTNSSFSWWGGFCADATCVIYPRQDGFFHYPAPAARFEIL
jgi:hypothetical protein